MFGMPLKSAPRRARDRSGRPSRETEVMPRNSNVGDRYDVPGTRPIPDPPPIFDANGADERSASSIKPDKRLLRVVWASQRRATLRSSTSVQ